MFEGQKSWLTLFTEGPLPNIVQFKGKGGHLNEVHITYYSQLLNLLSLCFRGPGKMFVHARADHLNAKKKCDECGEIYKLSVYKQHKIRKHGPGKSDDLIKVENSWIILKCLKFFMDLPISKALDNFL